METPIGIVLVEDNPADALLVQTALQEAGLVFDLKVFSDGEEIIRFIDGIDAAQPLVPAPDLILLDWNMPRYTGEEVLQHLRQSERCAKTAVIVLTSSQSPKDRERALQLGVADYFSKPCDYEEFMKLGERVKAFVQANKTEPVA